MHVTMEQEVAGVDISGVSRKTAIRVTYGVNGSAMYFTDTTWKAGVSSGNANECNMRAQPCRLDQSWSDSLRAHWGCECISDHLERGDKYEWQTDGSELYGTMYSESLRNVYLVLVLGWIVISLWMVLRVLDPGGIAGRRMQEAVRSRGALVYQVLRDAPCSADACIDRMSGWTDAWSKDTLRLCLWEMQCWMDMVQRSSAMYSAVQYSVVQYGTVPYRTVRYSTVQWCTVRYSSMVRWYGGVQYGV